MDSLKAFRDNCPYATVAYLWLSSTRHTRFEGLRRVHVGAVIPNFEKK